ncbi:hypothetical protein NC653_032704 [Populus alba x Populus x berolinensis]|uniref:Uncharacterized protein n=1 Tax=Populus alba x Populus x berolinensis TaxID=444605 RepID=A0AAD6PYB4_9ROSI|nr:hypothetical protein NC653_032704 [Populus alba x Populus x berolinensis]
MANGVINATAKANGCVGLVSTCWKLSHYLELYANKKIRVFTIQSTVRVKGHGGCGPVDGNRAPCPPLLGLLPLHLHRVEKERVLCCPS